MLGDLMVWGCRMQVIAANIRIPLPMRLAMKTERTPPSRENVVDGAMESFHTIGLILVWH